MPVSIDVCFTNGLSVKSSQEPYFLSDNGVEGRITIDERCRTRFDLIKISFEGVLLNSITYTDWPHGQQAAARKLQVLLRMSDVRKTSELVRQNHAGRMQATCTFKFHVPQCLGRNLLGEDSEFLSDLPPSLSCAGPDKGGVNALKFSSGQSRVFYSIRADVIRKETVIGTTTRFVRIIPTLQARPPLCVTDFGNEYTVQSVKALRSKSLMPRSKVGSFVIEAAEPEPVILRRPGETISADVPLKITLQSSTSPTSTLGRRADRDEAQFQEQRETIADADCSCAGTLVASTYISMNPRRVVPTNVEVDKDSMVIRNTAACSRATTTLKLAGDWTRCSDSGYWQKTARMRLNFEDFCNPEPLIPSFDSSMISHRFRIALTLQLEDPYRLTFTFDIPITIRYCGALDDQPPSFDQIYPMLDTSADTTPPLALTTSLEQELSSTNIQDLLRGPHEQVTHLPNIDLSEYHPRTIGIDAPPYVI